MINFLVFKEPRCLSKSAMLEKNLNYKGKDLLICQKRAHKKGKHGNFSRKTLLMLQMEQKHLYSLNVILGLQLTHISGWKLKPNQKCKLQVIVYRTPAK